MARQVTTVTLQLSLEVLHGRRYDFTYACVPMNLILGTYVCVWMVVLM